MHSGRSFSIALIAFVLCLAASPRFAHATSAKTEASPPRNVPTDWWSGVQRDIARSEYRIVRVAPSETGAEAVFQAPNRAQNFRTLFEPGGVRVIPRGTKLDEAPAWEWCLSLSAWGRDGAAPYVAAEPVRPRLEDERIEYRREGIVEWWANDPSGLELGFTIADRPAASGEASPLRLDLDSYGELVARVAQDRQAVDFLAPGGARPIRFDHLLVTDAERRELPSWFEMAPDRPQVLSIVVDDREATYPITVDPLATSPAWTAESDQASAWFGGSVATAGDVNGDGFSDVIVGAEQYDNGQSNEGRAYVYHGSAAGLSLTPAWTVESDLSNALLGGSVATAGDVNGDGFSDVIVGRRRSGILAPIGRAFVYHGSASGLSLTPSWTGGDDQLSSFFGSSVATAGDVNGDGFSDVIVGANGWDDGAQVDEGRAYVYHGSASGLGLTWAWAAEGDQVQSGFGQAVATAGDIDGDGFSDVIVGAPGFDNGSLGEGAAFLYRGSASGLDVTPSWTGEGGQPAAGYGWSVSTAGDVNGDGFSDVIVGATGYDNPETNEGRAFVYHGSAGGLSLAANWSAESGQAAALMGQSVAPAGDVNGDGFSDVIVGADSYDNPESNEGRAFVYHGSATGLSLAANWTAENNQMSSGLGWSVATAGDVNGDGFSDVIVGARYHDNVEVDEGRAYVYLGSPSGPSLAAGWSQTGTAGALFGFSVASAGDVNGDGYGDVVVGAQSYDGGEAFEGAAFLYPGTATGLSNTAIWTGEGGQANAGYGGSVAGAGDVNGDGYGDIIIGASLFDNGQTNEGRAFAYHGSPSGPSLAASWSIDGDQAGANLGGSVASAGDVNGDGYGDVIVGVSSYDNGETNEGRAYVHFGSASGLGATAGWTGESDQADALYGISVAGAGDVNGDGFSDVIVGAIAWDNGQVDEGRAIVYHGSSMGPSLGASWSLEVNQASAFYGQSVASAGDVNGDGYSDVIVGAHFFDNGQVNEGRAWAYHGSATGLSLTHSWSAESNQAEARFGASVASAGDVNGDGYSDVIVGAYQYDNGQADEGAAWMYRGSATGLSLTASWIGEGGQVGASYGNCVASAGDVNGDGYGDAIVGAYFFDGAFTNGGSAFLYYGNGGASRSVRLRQLRTDGVTPIAPLGLSDSPTEFRIAGTLLSVYGRTRLRMEYEVKPRGTLLDGTGTVTGAFTGTGSDGQVDVVELVGGLLSDRLYHWRARVHYDLASTPFQRKGPWLQAPGQGWNEADLRTPTQNAVWRPRPTGFALRAAGPNPGHGRCGVALVTTRPARVDVDVLDVQGRAVAMLARGAFYEAGSHVLTWDGRDARGDRARPGVYLVRARVDGQIGVHKAVLAR